MVDWGSSAVWLSVVDWGSGAGWLPLVDWGSVAGGLWGAGRTTMGRDGAGRWGPAGCPEVAEVRGDQALATVEAMVAVMAAT